jgi:hypothetical protein
MVFVCLSFFCDLQRAPLVDLCTRYSDNSTGCNKRSLGSIPVMGMRPLSSPEGRDWFWGPGCKSANG